MFERILLPLDGSDDWEKVLPHLELLSSAGVSEVIALEAVQFLETLLEMPKAFAGMDLGTGGDTDVAERYVSSVVSILKSRGMDARGITQIGSEVSTIASVARRQRATLILLPIREPGGFHWGQFRTLAEQVLRASPTPVYAIPTHDGTSVVPPPPSAGTMLIPVDGTGLSLQVMPAAAELCHRTALKILLVHVVPPTASRKDADLAFQKALRQVEREGLEAQTWLGMGDPAAEILKCAKERHVSMIAMRTRLAQNERKGPLGSVTVEVLRSAHVPMLIVRRPPRDGQVAQPSSLRTRSASGMP